MNSKDEKLEVKEKKDVKLDVKSSKLSHENHNQTDSKLFVDFWIKQFEKYNYFFFSF